MDRKWNRLLSHLRSPLGQLVEVGEVRASQGGMARFRYLQRYALVLITRGEGIYEDENGRERSLVAGDWVLVLPELGHSYRPLVSGGWDEFYVMFEGPAFDVWRDEGLIEASRVSGRLGDTAAWIERMLGEVVDTDAGASTRICRFQALLAEVLEGSVENWTPVVDGPRWFADACRLLSRPEAKVKAVAAELELPYETFRRRFRQHAGMPPHRYHRQQVVNRAAHLLETTQMKSADIAESMGFCDEPHFSRAFRQFTGRAPSEYRKRH